MATKQIELQFPLGGLDRSQRFQSQPPYTAKDLQNVRVHGTFMDRARGGQRPGLEKYSQTQLGSGAPIRSLHQVDTGDDDAITTSGSDEFVTDGSDLGAGWNDTAWCTDQPSVHGNWRYIYQNASSNATSTAAVRDALSIDTTEQYLIEIDIEQPNLYINGLYYIYARMDDSSPDVRTEGIEAMLELSSTPGTDVTYGGALIEWNSGIPTAHAFNTGTATDLRTFTLQVKVDGNDVSVDLSGTELLAATTVTTVTGTRVGFGMSPNYATIPAYVTRFAVISTPSSPTPLDGRRSRLLAVSGGNLYYESTPKVFTQISGPTLSSTHALSMCQGAQKAYIGEYNTSGTGVIYEIDPKTPSATELTATAGTAPLNPYVLQIYLDRLFAISNNQWYCTRQGDYTDWDTTATDVGRAVNGQNSDAGRIAEAIRAAVAFSDDTMIFGSQNTLYALRGDPADGGMIDVLSKNYGIIDRFAVCFGPEGELYGLSRNGLFWLAPSGGSRPQILSERVLPEELQNIDTASLEVSIGYDGVENGVHVYLTPRINTEAVHWFMSLEEQSWWRDTYTRNHQPTSTHYYRTDIPGHSGMLVGCHDGYIRRYNSDMQTDDGTDIDSWVEYGPIMMGTAGYEGMINELIGVAGGDGGDIAWTLTTSRSAEELYGGTTREWTGTWTANGHNYTKRPRARGAAMKLRIGNSGSESWTIEQIRVSRGPAAKLLLK